MWYLVFQMVPLYGENLKIPILGYWIVHEVNPFYSANTNDH